MRDKPDAISIIKGSKAYSNINGKVMFYQTNQGVLVVADILGLPSPIEKCANPVFAFHIHEGESCTGDMLDDFANAMKHYNPNNCPHPYHAGDLPPLFGNDGTAFSAFLTNRFTVKEVVGRTIIIHDKPDDFTTQPSGNSGNKIACGKIRK
ncbi:MAG: superoxide dismutase family protein [Clostridia bacterium]|nr:superoxide dismutase family protein [Clostridia bacterium]